MEHSGTLRNLTKLFVSTAALLLFSFQISKSEIKSPLPAPTGNHSIAICTSGTLIGFGDNNACQLGMGYSTIDEDPPEPVINLTDIVATSTGGGHNLALKDDGTVWVWGNNNLKQSANSNTANDVCTPTEVQGMGCAVAVAAGAAFSMVLMADGTIYTWGSNSNGQLGLGSMTSPTHIPTQIPSISNAIAISAGTHHAMALLDDGTVRVWGQGTNGEIGNGSTTNNNPTPTAPSSPTLSNIERIEAGGSHCMALETNGKLYVWGHNHKGQLGLNISPNPSTVLNPTSTPAPGGTIIDLTAGLHHSILLYANGDLKACGSNAKHEVNCSTSSFFTAWQSGPAVAGITDIYASSSFDHNLAITSSGDLYTWGNNDASQLGAGIPNSDACNPQPVNTSGRACSVKPSVDYEPQPCCVAINEAGRTELGTQTYPTGPTPTTYTSQNMAITGILTIPSGATVIFNSSDVVCTEDAKFVVESGGRLYIQNNTHLYACENMWHGIEALNASRVYIRSGAKLEDAITGLDVEYGAFYQIHDANFNKNFTHFFKTMPTSGTPTNTGDYRILRSEFLCHTAGGAHTTLLPPHAGDRTSAAIVATGVPKLLVGSSSAADENIIDNCEYGIFNLTVDRVEVLHNKLEDIGNIGAYASYGAGNGGETIDINHNEFDRMPYPIFCYDNDTTVRTHITYNEIEFAGMTNPPTEMVGITVSEVTPPSLAQTANFVDVSHNEIYNAPSGIHLENMLGNRLAPVAELYVGDNVITHTRAQSFNDGAGIKTNNVGEIAISNNIISHPTGGHNWWESSIRISGGNRNAATCNYISHHGRGFVTDNDIRPSSHFIENQFTDYLVGFFLHYSKIGDQVDVSTGEPFDNQWISNWGWASSAHIECYGLAANGNFSKFTVRNTGATYYPSTRVGNNFGIAVPTPTTTSLTWTDSCSYRGPAFKTGGAEGAPSPAAEALSILEEAEQVLTEVEEATNWNARFNLYRSLQRDDELLYSDEALQQFATTQEDDNIGMLYRAMAEVNGNDVLNEEIVAALQSLEPTNRPEYTLKQVLQVLITEEEQLNEENEVLLREIAQRCPIDDGFGVYIARAALLKVDTLPKHYTSDCERMPTPEEIAEKRSSEEDDGFLVYPNPTVSQISVQYDLNEGDVGVLFITDISGRLVFQNMLSSESTKLDFNLSDLSSGLYAIRIEVNGFLKHTDKISVIRP